MNRHPIAIPVLIVLAAFWIVMLTHLMLAAPASAAPRHDLSRHPKVCATVNNATNTARWIKAIGTEYHAYVAHYAGDNVDATGHLIYDAPVPRAVRLAEAKLLTGTSGPKIARACTY